jgi:parallel beta-helix repeat protein
MKVERQRRVAILSSALLCFSAAPAFARTLVVDNDVAECPQAEYNTIQQAVAVAQAGDKILVCPGRYQGTVVVDTPDLRIEAQAAPGEVVLQGTGAVGELGFHLLHTSGVVLQGFTVQGFGRANIRIEGGSGNTVRKNVTRGAVVNDGIQVTSSSANVIEENTSHGNREDGIFVGRITDILFLPASDNVIRHNETFSNRDGINILGSGPGNLIFGNRSHDNAQRGISNANLSHGNQIEYNQVFANGLTPIPGAMGVGVGILVANSSGVIVSNNRTEGNGTNGIALTAAPAGNVAANNVVRNNRSDDNGSAGVLFNGSSSNLVERNELLRNRQDGVRITNNAASNTVQANHIWRSGRDGIRAELASLGNTIERNIIRESVEHDAHDDSVGAGTGGTANFWIDDHCETENRIGLCDH